MTLSPKWRQTHPGTTEEHWDPGKGEESQRIISNRIECIHSGRKIHTMHKMSDCSDSDSTKMTSEITCTSLRQGAASLWISHQSLQNFYIASYWLNLGISRAMTIHCVLNVLAHQVYYIIHLHQMQLHSSFKTHQQYLPSVTAYLNPNNADWGYWSIRVGCTFCLAGFMFAVCKE